MASGGLSAIRGLSLFARSGCAQDQPHIRSSRFGRPHLDSDFDGEVREAVPFFAAAFEAKQSIGRRPGSAEARSLPAFDTLYSCPIFPLRQGRRRQAE
jgi:hypothetical protein